MEIILVRHSIAAGNPERRFLGVTDMPLLPEGIALAKERGVYTGRKRSVSDETLQKVKNMVQQGIPLAKAAALNHVSRSTVYRYLKIQTKEE